VARHGLLGTLGATAASADTGNGNSAAISAYYWQPNGHALSGPQSAAPAPFGGDLALISVKAHGQDINNTTITVTGYLDPSTLVTPGSSADTAALARIWFNGAGGTSDQSPQGYLGQVWWAHPSSAVLDLNTQSGAFILTVKVALTSDWSDWNGKGADQNQALFTQAASHVQEMGLSFGGNNFFEDGDTGSGSITVTSITAG
jgi:hypothetical protein